MLGRLNYRKITVQYPWSVITFIILILILHFSFEGWESINFIPLSRIIENVMRLEINILISQVDWILNLTGIRFFRENNTFFITSLDQSTGWMSIDPECTSIRGWFYWVFIMIAVAGPWKHKIWYFPLGIILIQTINVLRIYALGIVLYYSPEKFGTYHEILGYLFHVVLFFLWVIWIEKIANRIIT